MQWWAFKTLFVHRDQTLNEDKYLVYTSPHHYINILLVTVLFQFLFQVL